MAHLRYDSQDFKKYTIKPSDIGYEAEAGEEMAFHSRSLFERAKQQPKINSRPPIMLYPGE